MSDETATRYSGDLTIRATLLEERDWPFDVTVSDLEAETKVRVHLPASWDKAIDCEEAYDEIARAAVSFALEARDDQGHQVLDESAVAYDGELTSVHVSRHKDQAWPD